MKTQTTNPDTTDLFSRQLQLLDRLLPQMHERIEEVGKAVNALLNTNWKAGIAELKKRNISEKMAIRLQKVGLNQLDTRIFSSDSYIGTLAETLSIKEQRLLLDKGVRVIIGGRSDKPTSSVLKFGDLTTYNAALLIDKERGRLRTLAEQIKKRNKTIDVKRVSKKTPDYEVRDNIITFYRTEWAIPELKRLLRSITRPQALGHR